MTDPWFTPAGIGRPWHLPCYRCGRPIMADAVVGKAEICHKLIGDSAITCTLRLLPRLSWSTLLALRHG